MAGRTAPMCSHEAYEVIRSTAKMLGITQVELFDHYVVPLLLRTARDDVAEVVKRHKAVLAKYKEAVQD